MDEHFLVLLTKSVPLFILILLCKLDFGPKPWSLVHMAHGQAPHDNSPKTESGGLVSRQLPRREEETLNNFLSKLEYESFTNSYCNEPPSQKQSVRIECSIDIKDNHWHINAIIMESARLSGVIHTDVSNLKNLQTLDLSQNKIHGSIPHNLGFLSSLTTLDLSDNQLTGSIPTTLGNLKNLKKLELSLNLLSGQIPPSLGKLSSLLELDLWCNKLTGPIPRELGNLSQLQYLGLDENELNGTLPKELKKLSNLQSLWLSSNTLIGELPREYEAIRGLKLFSVAGNYLGGPIHPFIANWVNLTYLYLFGNNFEGELPPAIFNMTRLEHLIVSDLNSSRGFKFPDSAKFKNMITMILRNCNVNGEIPSYIGNWSALKNLDLSFNSLTGGIPRSFERLNLDTMFLNQNFLNGTIPPWIEKKVSKSGDLQYNNFENVSLPESKINVEPMNRTFLNDIMAKNCSDKKFKYQLFINAGGEETTSEGNHYDADNTTSKFYVNPTKNWAYSCSGDFLVAETNSSNLIQKMTCGVSATEAPLYENARLCPQSLTYYGFCLHNGNYTVKLHFAEVVFSKDEDHSSSGKRVFDVYIQGKQVLKNFNIKEKAGGANTTWTENFTVVHNHTLEIRLLWAGKGSFYNPPTFNGPLISAITVTPNFKVGGLSTLQIVGIVIGSVIAVISTILLLLAFMWRMGWLGDRELRMTQVTLLGKTYTLKQVKDATRNFSPRNEIGKGRFGIVYKAELADHQIVAVKKLSFQSKVDQIGTEVYALENLQHENIVKLLHVYSKRELNLLIYEYMERGSLKQALFDESNSNVQLDWPTRVNICFGIAKGLKYLHEDTSNKIVHRNVKASNILLDGNFNAKVSDLGLAKLYDEENPYKFIQEIGTAVYMAPEYAMRQSITVKADVYSYGIVLLEIVSGKSNSKKDDNQENEYLVNKACVLHSEKRLLDLVDENLSDDYDRQQAEKILDLAMKCINLSPTLRPRMSEVVIELDHISKLNTPSA